MSEDRKDYDLQYASMVVRLDLQPKDLEHLWDSVFVAGIGVREVRENINSALYQNLFKHFEGRELAILQLVLDDAELLTVSSARALEIHKIFASAKSPEHQRPKLTTVNNFTQEKMEKLTRQAVGEVIEVWSKNNIR